jgi:hypothetical protein
MFSTVGAVDIAITHIGWMHLKFLDAARVATYASITPHLRKIWIVD